MQKRAEDGLCKSNRSWLRWIGLTFLGVLTGGAIGAVFNAGLEAARPLPLRLDDSATALAMPLILGATGGAIAQWMQLRWILVRPKRWLVATAVGGAVGMGYCAGLVFGPELLPNSWALPLSEDAIWFVSLPLMLLGGLPLGLWQQRILPPGPWKRQWTAVTVASGIVAAPMAVISAILSHMAISPLIDDADAADAGEVWFSYGLAIAFGISVGWAIVAACTGVLLQHMPGDAKPDTGDRNLGSPAASLL
jgi:hypothetical protein